MPSTSFLICASMSSSLASESPSSSSLPTVSSMVYTAWQVLGRKVYQKRHSTLANLGKEIHCLSDAFTFTAHITGDQNTPVAALDEIPATLLLLPFGTTSLCIAVSY